MTNLRSADSPDQDRSGFDQDFFEDYCHYFLEVCLDQITFMDKILGLQRIDAYIKDRDKKEAPCTPWIRAPANCSKPCSCKGPSPGEKRVRSWEKTRTCHEK